MLRKFMALVLGLGATGIHCKAKGKFRRLLRFDTYFDFALFELGTVEDVQPPSSVCFHCSFPEGLNPYWIKAIEGYLRCIGIDCVPEVADGTVILGFDTFSQRAAFQTAVEDGTIDKMATALWQSSLLLGEKRLPHCDKLPVLPSRY